MKEIVTYSDAVFSMVVAIRNKVTDAFTASTILAIMFDMEKEDTLDSIMNTFFKQKPGKISVGNRSSRNKFEVLGGTHVTQKTKSKYNTKKDCRSRQKGNDSALQTWSQD